MIRSYSFCHLDFSHIDSSHIVEINAFTIFQVWAGNEDCEPVTWRECELVPRQVSLPNI